MNKIKEYFYKACNENTKTIIELASEFEKEFNKNLYEFNYEEAEKVIKSFEKNKNEVAQAIWDYVNFANEQGFMPSKLNIFTCFLEDEE